VVLYSIPGGVDGRHTLLGMERGIRSIRHKPARRDIWSRLHGNAGNQRRAVYSDDDNKRRRRSVGQRNA